MRIIFRINPHSMVINMLVILSYIFKRLSSIMSNGHPSIHYIYHILIYRVCKNLLIIITTGNFSTLLNPCLSSIGRFIKSTFSFSRFNNCINNLWISIRNIHSNSTNFYTWKPLIYFFP